jgi:hypothetical protein
MANSLDPVIASVTLQDTNVLEICRIRSGVEHDLPYNCVLSIETTAYIDTHRARLKQHV